MGLSVLGWGELELGWAGFGELSPVLMARLIAWSKIELNLVGDGMGLLGLLPEWVVFKDLGKGFVSRQTSNPSRTWKKLTFSK